MPSSYRVSQHKAICSPRTTSQCSPASVIRLSHTVKSEETSTIAGRGWDKLRFRQPGVVGDELRVRITHIERQAGSRPERGVLISRFELFNQRAEVLVSFDNNVVMLRREPAPA